MDNVKILILSFKKSNGNSFSFNVPYPKDDVSANDIKNLADFMLKNDMIQFKDETTLSSFEKAFMQEVSKTPINFES